MSNKTSGIPSLLALTFVAALAAQSYVMADEPGADEPGADEGARPPAEATRCASGCKHPDQLDRTSSGLTLVEMAMSAFAPSVIARFKDLWHSVAFGKLPLENVMLILRTSAGYRAQSLRVTNEYNQSTFSLPSGTIAIVHTHPDSCSPKPSSGDRRLALEHHLAVFTLSSRGMFVYDPETGETTRLMDGLDWLDPAKWSTPHR